MSYQLFMEDYRLAEVEEMYKFLENKSKDEEDNGKEGVYKINYYLRDHLQIPYVSEVLAKPRTQEALIEFTGKFMDDHSTQLSTAGPVYIFTFGDKEVSFLYNLFKINGNIILKMYEEMVNETFYGKISSFITGWVKNAPHKLLLTSILIEALQKGYDDVVTCCEYLWAFCEYPLVYRIFWKTGVKEDVMNYTIEHLSSTKFIIKKTKNLQEYLKYHANSSVTSNGDKLKTGADHVYTDFMNRMRNQMKNAFKNIAIAYYANDENNASQHNKSAQFDDGSLADQEGHITNIAQIVDKTTNKFTSGNINAAMAKVAADGASVDKDNLIGYLNQINSSKNNKIPKLIEDIITSYFNKNPTDTTVGGSEFLNFGLALYRSIGTSKDPLYQEIREILNYWMFDIINIKQYYQREGTIINYTRAIFNYMILMIEYYN